jgi:hypothetical protein
VAAALAASVVVKKLAWCNERARPALRLVGHWWGLLAGEILVAALSAGAGVVVGEGLLGPGPLDRDKAPA